MPQQDSLNFGSHSWRILTRQSDRALIIAEAIIALRWYHNAFTNVTWADCALRAYLNTEFYASFSPAEREKILVAANLNPNNPWFKTSGGTATTDHIFLLSLEEVCTYFGNSMAALQTKGTNRWAIDDENNSQRQAAYNNEPHWWRLRSPGYYGRTAASVSANGAVYVRGNGVHGRPKDGGGLRPALWLRLED